MDKTIQDYTKKTCHIGVDHIESIRKKSNLRTHPDQVMKERDDLHIDFAPEDEDEADKFKTFITDELRYRLTKSAFKDFVVHNRGLKARRARLREMVENEEEILQVHETLIMQEEIRKSGEALLIENALPCVLHAEMRINEKLFYTFLEGVQSIRRPSKVERRMQDSPGRHHEWRHLGE
jgi:hypothetical protein